MMIDNDDWRWSKMIDDDRQRLMKIDEDGWWSTIIDNE